MCDRPRLATFADVLRWRATEQPRATAFSWLANDADNDGADVTLTYGELDRRARAVGALLLQEGPPGERALLLFAPGLDFVAALFGCLYAGWIAVPAYPPPLNQRLGRIQAVARDAQPAVALASSTLLDQVCARVSDDDRLAHLHWRTLEDAFASSDPGAVSKDAGAADDWRPPRLEPNDLAVLQYTSGSTAAPRGVMLTHANLLHNAAQIEQRFGIVNAADASRGVIWLPPYHDMGLVGGILEGVFGGFPIDLMAPVAFLQRPRRWLEAISRTRATISGGPNFAYDLCVERIPAVERAGLDLSSWRVAFNGSEPVREATLRRFAAAFGPCGFRTEAFYPCYGLAEATLMVAGGCASAPPIVLTQGGDPALVGCGHSIDGQQLLIVEPSTGRVCEPGQVGEVWVTGPSVAAGYWRQPGLTEEGFGGTPSAGAELGHRGDGDTSQRRYLRTGDLGFMRDRELFITGRLKAVLIMGGRNIQAEDVEATLAEGVAGARSGGLVALSVDTGGQERLVIVQEVSRTRHSEAELETLARSIRARVAAAHQLSVWAVALVRPGGVPRTSSGKVQRGACHTAFLNDQLQTVYEWRATQDRPDQAVSA
jgi:acyl-CoA synthetase (AMP-forming)/AMP-acid ligase II